MLRDRYPAMNLFEYVPALSYELDPVLARLDELLEEDRVFQAVRADLVQRFPRTACDGRPSTPVEVILRMLVVKHLYGWSYEETEQWVGDSLVLRQFCRVYLKRVPDDTTLLRWANLIQPETVHELLDHIAHLAQQVKVTRGRKLRLDGTVVETNIHHPTDSTLLYDGVRVLSRTLKQAQRVLAGTGGLVQRVFRDRTRSAKRQMKRIMHTARQRGEQAAERMQTAYQQLVAIAQASVQQAEQVTHTVHDQARAAARKVAATLDHFVPLVRQVIAQTTRRVLAGESVPAREKVVSLFEPHTAILRKGKPGRPTEFGRVVWLDEVEGGIITRYEILDGNPAEDRQLRPSLDHHLACFGKPPRLLAGDRGVYSPDGEQYAHSRGVQQVALPHPGAKSAPRQAYERQSWFRRARNWRSGIEGRISGLKRRHKLDRCHYHGDEGMERWVGWGLIAHDLWVIARATAH